MKILLWIAQGILAYMFFMSGWTKLFAFDRMAAHMPELAGQHGLFIFIGSCEVAGAFGLVLPLLTGIYPILTAWAAAGLATIMVLAAGFHLYRREFDHLPIVIILFLLASFVVYGLGFRRKASPLSS